MPPGSGIEPLRLFRTLQRHADLADRLRGVGSLFLGRRSRVAPRVRELLVLRTSARCGAEYEWGVHAIAFAGAVGLDETTLHATATRTPEDLRLENDDDALVVRLVDELHDEANVSNALWSLLAARFSEEELLEMIAIVGFYHLVAFTLNAASIAREPWAARFPESRP
jgi:alkylhydroperoxidase family enzyme